MSLEKYLKDIGEEDRPLRHSGLLQLSGLSNEELAEFRAAWMTLSLERKHDVLNGLIGLCEDNLELEFTAVFHACLVDDDDAVRENATRGLWECDDRMIIRPLIALVKSDPAARVRAAASTSLGKFADMAQNGKLLDRDAERIQEALQSVIANEDEDTEVRRRAVEAVASFNTPEVQEIIREAYGNEDQKVKQSSIYAMGRSSDSQWLPIVLDEMSHEDPAMRYEAANACGQLGDESTVPHLIRLIKDEDPQVQLSAVQALGAIGGPLAKRALLQCLKIGDEPLEDAAQVALGHIEFDEDPLSFRFQH